MASNVISIKDCVIKEGFDIDLYSTQKDLVCKTKKQLRFRRRNPAVTKLLLENQDNPQLEQGNISFDDKGIRRDHLGELFITKDVAKAIIEKNIENGKYKFNYFIALENNEGKLHDYLKDLKLNNGENCMILYIEDCHCFAAYITKISDDIKIYIFDTQTVDTIMTHEIYEALENKFSDAFFYCNGVKLQRDFYSCTTIVLKFVSLMGKMGNLIIDNISDASKLTKGIVSNRFYVKPEYTPPELLKFSQFKLEIKKSNKAWDQIVSKKKNLTLRQYMDIYTKKENDKFINYAALLSKYKILRKVELSLG